MSETSRGGVVGRSFGHYRLDGELGQGGFGRVLAAWDERLGRDVAIKFVDDDPRRQQSLRIEAKRLAEQRHPTFVRVFALEESMGQLGLVMERVHGKTLTQLLQDSGAMPLAQVLSYGLQAARALADAHASGWAHGDLKPDNLMLTSDGTLRILDFGAAATLDPLETSSLSADRTPAGTLAYLPPERLLGMRVAASGDLYSLGLVFHESLLGHRHSNAHDGWESLHERLYGDRRGLMLPAGFDEDVRNLIEGMTRRRPQDRLPSMQEVVDQLTELHRRLAGIESHRRSWRNKPALTALVSLCLLAGYVACLPLVQAPSTADVGPTSTEKLNAAERSIDSFDQPGAVADAARILDGILATKPGYAPALALRAITDCLRYAGDERDATWLDRAKEASLLAVRADPQLALAQAALGWSEEYQGRKDAAEAIYQRALMLDPNDRYALLGLARIYVAERRQDEAAKVLEDAVKRHPRERWFSDMRGTLAYQRGDLGGAEQSFRRSIEVKPDGIQGYVNLSGVLLKQDRKDEALTVLQRGMRVGPNARLYGNLGTVLFALGRYSEAAEAFEQALSASKGSPNDYLKWANLGDSLRWVPGREAQAQRAYTRAGQMVEEQLQRVAGDATLLSRAALYAARLGKSTQAQRRILEALALAPEDAEVLFRATLVSELSGRREAALDYLRRSFARGFPPHMIASEPDLISLRRDRKYHYVLNEKN
ncbi:serine/threonine-protein kinase [Xanthomonas arboricola]